MQTAEITQALRTGESKRVRIVEAPVSATIAAYKGVLATV